jgi:hypothetical protein
MTALPPGWPVDVDNIVFDGQEYWHNVGAPGGPPFAATWGNFGDRYAGAQFRRDPQGWVTVRGLVKSSSDTAGTIFNLPVGYRPGTAMHIYQSEVTSNHAGVVEYPASGNVTFQAGNSVDHVSLQVRFHAEQ